MKTTVILFILTFGILIYANTCGGISKDNSPEMQWWNSLNETWQIVFLREIDKIGEKPSEEDLLQILNLESVSCDHFPLGESNLDPLRSLKRLKSISAGSTYITSIDALSDLDSLEFVNLAATSIANIEALRGHSNLESVYLQQTLVTDLSPLKDKDKLQVVVFSETDISSILPLMELPILSIVSFSTTKVPEEQIIKFMEKHKDCEIGFDSGRSSDDIEIFVPEEEDFHWNPGTAPNNRMENVIVGDLWAIKSCDFQTAFIEDYFNFISQKKTMPVGIQLSNTRLGTLLINKQYLGASDWVYKVYNTETQAEEGISKMIEADYTPLGMTLSSHDYHFLFAKLPTSCIAWQLVKTDMGFENSSSEIQSLIEKGYVPVGISIMEQLFYTLLVNTDEFVAENYSIVCYSTNNTVELQTAIDKEISNNMLPMGYLETGDSITILYINWK